jgi:NADH:ubiquinone oxidoreductase subunit E
MKVEVCAGARCTMFGADVIYSRIEEVKNQIHDRYIDQDGVHVDPIELEYVNCTGHCKEDKKASPIVIVDGKVFTNAKSEEVMEYIINKAFEANFD